MQYQICLAAIESDIARAEGWAYLAKHLTAWPDEYQSIDVLTPGNMLCREGKLVFSDPLRHVVTVAD